MKKLRLLLVDDHAVVREGLRSLLGTDRHRLAQQRIGDNEAASSSFTNAIEFEDNYEAAYRRMADLMQQMGRAELAREYREKADQLAPKPEQQSAQ